MSVFVDTSALLATLEAGDEDQARAARSFRGLAAVRRFEDDVAPVLDVVWADRDLHEEGRAAGFSGA